MNKRFLSKYDGKKREWLHAALLLVLMLLIAFAVFKIVFGVSTVSGDSMEPGLHAGDIVIYLRMGRSYEIGDVVAVSMPSGESYIKRVAGLPGDFLDIRNGLLYRNGMGEVIYARVGDTYPQVDTVLFPLEVEEGRYFVLGDNRENSIDSRTFGTVGENQIKGRVVYVFR